MDHQKLAEYLEVLCQSGCDAVNATIEALEENQADSMTDRLSPDERSMVLQELKSIMSVYKQ